MSAPFTVQGIAGLPGVDEIIVSSDGTTLSVPQLILRSRTAAPAAVPAAIGAVMYADPTTGQPTFLAPDGATSTLVDAEPDSTGNGLITWNMDPASAGNATILTTSATVYLMRVRVGWPGTISKICITITTAGNTLTSNRNFLGLYNNLGQQLGVTADQTTAFGSAGFLAASLTTPVQVLSGTYYAAVLATGTTLPTLQAGAGLTANSVSVGNANLAAASARFLVGPAAQTSLPATIALGSQSLNAAATWWVGLA